MQNKHDFDKKQIFWKRFMALDVKYLLYKTLEYYIITNCTCVGIMEELVWNTHFNANRASYVYFKYYLHIICNIFIIHARKCSVRVCIQLNVTDFE